MVQSVCEDATGGGDQIGKLLWDLVGARSLLLLFVPVWEAGRSQRQGLFDRAEAASVGGERQHAEEVWSSRSPRNVAQQLEQARHRW